jgi:hypothetical protein
MFCLSTGETGIEVSSTFVRGWNNGVLMLESLNSSQTFTHESNSGATGVPGSFGAPETFRARCRTFSPTSRHQVRSCLDRVVWASTELIVEKFLRVK